MNTDERQSKTANFQRKLRERAENLKERTEKTSIHALEHVLQDRMDTYFSQESRLEEIESVLAQIREEIEETQDLNRLRRISDRLNFLEDHLEEVDSVLYDRPMRLVRSRFNPFDFFRQWQAGTGSSSGGEIQSEAEAYRELGLEAHCNPREIKRTFRKLIKRLHPDQNHGDRTHEPRMRRLVAAYEFLIRRR
jgi:DnaJ-domain-containing protein 1